MFRIFNIYWPSLHRAFNTRIRYYIRIKFVLNI